MFQGGGLPVADGQPGCGVCCFRWDGLPPAPGPTRCWPVEPKNVSVAGEGLIEGGTRVEVGELREASTLTCEMLVAGDGFDYAETLHEFKGNAVRKTQSAGGNGSGEPGIMTWGLRVGYWAVFASDFRDGLMGGGSGARGNGCYLTEQRGEEFPLFVCRQLAELFQEFSGNLAHALNLNRRSALAIAFPESLSFL